MWTSRRWQEKREKGVKLFTKLYHLSHLSQCPIVPYNEKKCNKKIIY